MYHAHRRQPPHYQHFLHNRQLVSRLVNYAHFSKADTVLEIGPGKGIITRELLHAAGRVIAVEIDPKLTTILSHKIPNPNFVLFNQDFGQFPLPQTLYHVFANLPFAEEGDIARRLLDSPSLQSAYLVVIKAVGERWVGHKHESFFSLNHKPWFEMAVLHHFKRSDFDPSPKIDSVMIAIKKRSQPLLSANQKENYIRFIHTAFSGGRRINQNLKPFFTSQQLNQLSKQYDFSVQAKPTDLTLTHWLELFKSKNIIRI